MVCKPCSGGPLGLFWPKSNEANHQPQVQVYSPESILAPNLDIPKNGQKDPRTQIGQEPHSGHFQPLASGNHQKPPAQVQKGFPSIQGKESPTPRIQAWCIYEIYSLSQVRAEGVLTPNPRATLDGTPAVPQLRDQLDRGSHIQGAEPSIKEGRGTRRSNSFSRVVGKFQGLSRTTLEGPGEDGEEEEENSGEEEDSDGTEGVPAPVGAFQGIGGTSLAQSDQSISHQSEQSLLEIMQQMTQIMANLQEASSSESQRPPAFKTPSMKAPECFDGTQPFKVRSFIQSCQLIFHNDLENVSQDRKNVLYATSFLIGRAEKWIEPYLSNLTNKDPRYLLNYWKSFESQLFTLFGDANEVIKDEVELDAIRMNNGGHVSLQIAYFRSFVSEIGDWGERALIHHFRKGLPSRILDQLASHASKIESLEDLMDMTHELDTRYLERQKGKSNNKERKPESSKSNSSHP
ncbi:hypothetical protein O181_002934 [Austropuccinia psidii MF-1]|uniref:Ty3 transposon capsid-like protein domain-containing protein n=1 Tax=Austropuccinia psidii MF-1 TaxID=1389203 RepID=A0A9Q3BDD8_9BASI|nr:hypothetical protein [Austropuccinia psidii MF-1]